MRDDFTGKSGHTCPLLFVNGLVKYVLGIRTQCLKLSTDWSNMSWVQGHDVSNWGSKSDVVSNRILTFDLVSERILTSCQPLSVTSGQKRVRGAINFSSSLLWHANDKKHNERPPLSPQARYTFLCLHRHSLPQLLPFSAQILTLVLLYPPAHFLVCFARDTFFSRSSFCPLSQLHFHYIPSSAPVPFSFLFPPLSLQRRYVLSENSKITRNVNSRISDKRARRNKWASNRGPAERQRRFENQ